MSLLQAIVLGAIQGLTEFLPISSDGHLIVVDWLFGERAAGGGSLGFDILLHGGSLLALLIVDAAIWRRLLLSPFTGDRASRKLLLLLILATIPAVIAGLLLEDLIGGTWRSVTMAAIGFAVTAVVLLAGELFGGKKAGTAGIGWKSALLVGCAQAVAILPGVSRSGCTVSAGRLLGLDRKTALNFSFLMAVPVIGGAIAKTLLDALTGSVTFPPLTVSAAGLALSFIVSLLAIWLLRRFVTVRSFGWFSLYLLPLAGTLLVFDWEITRLFDVPHLTSYVRMYGPIALFVFALMESVPPISFVSPGVLFLLVAGSLLPDLQTGVISLVAAFAGAVAGNSCMFLIGEFYGRDIAHRFGLTEKRLKPVDKFMQRFGSISVFCGQFVSVARPAVAFVAGASRMPRGWFYSSMVLSSAMWAATYLAFGYLLRAHILLSVSVLATAGTAFALALFLIGVWRGIRRRAGQETAHTERF